MNTRKSPVLLITALVVLIGGAAIMQLKPSDGSNPQQQPDQNSDVVDKGRESGSTQAVAAKVKEQANVKQRGMTPESAEAENKEPALLLPAVADYKPEPNPVQTSAQWYRDSHSQQTSTGK